MALDGAVVVESLALEAADEVIGAKVRPILRQTDAGAAVVLLPHRNLSRLGGALDRSLNRSGRVGEEAPNLKPNAAARLLPPALQHALPLALLPLRLLDARILVIVEPHIGRVFLHCSRHRRGHRRVIGLANERDDSVAIAARARLGGAISRGLARPLVVGVPINRLVAEAALMLLLLLAMIVAAVPSCVETWGLLLVVNCLHLVRWEDGARAGGGGG